MELEPRTPTTTAPAETGFMEHLTIAESLPPENGPTMAWGEHVSDDDCRRPQHAGERHTKGVTDE